MTRSEVFQLRLSPAERAQLEVDADGQSLSGYIRDRLGLGAIQLVEGAFEQRVRELSKTLPVSTVRKIAQQELS